MDEAKAGCKLGTPAGTIDRLPLIKLWSLRALVRIGFNPTINVSLRRPHEVAQIRLTLTAVEALPAIKDPSLLEDYQNWRRSKSWFVGGVTRGGNVGIDIVYPRHESGRYSLIG